VPLDNDTPSNDGNACTQTDICQNGVCDDSNPVVCTPVDACHVAGTCHPAMGQCTTPNAPNRTVCAGSDTTTSVCGNRTCCDGCCGVGDVCGACLAFVTSALHDGVFGRAKWGR
jgi:hypothetical protein